MDKKLIIFDFDGVLRSISWEGMHDAYVAIIKHKQKNPADFFTNMEGFKKWYQLDYRKNLQDIGNIKEEEIPAINKIFHSHYDHRTYIFPWVTYILPKLAKKHEMAILSLSTSASVLDSIGKLRLFFPIILGSEDVKKFKPNPEGIYLIQKYMGIDFSEILMIGDTASDVEVGKRAGIKTGVTSWGMGDINDLRALNPDYVFEHSEDLLSL